MDLDFDKYCLVDGSPTTVLPPPSCHSRLANRKSSQKPRYINEIPSISEDLELKFSASLRDFQSERVLKRESIYHSSRDVCLLRKTDAAVEREKIDLCISDEDTFLVEENRSPSMSSDQSTSSVYENQVDFCSNDSMITFDSPVKEISQEKDAVNLHEPLSVKSPLPHSPSKSRFSPIKKMLDPFVKSKSHRSPLSSFSELSPAHLQGLFKLGNKHGAPFFHFSVKSSEDVYVAKSWKAENASNWVYTFHSVPHRRRFKESSRESCMVGQMHVSCCQCTEFNGAGESKDLIVTEFVLYDTIQSSCSDEVIKGSQPLAVAKLHPGLEIAAIVMQAPLEKRESLKFKSGDRETDETPPNLLDLFQLGKDSSDIWSPGKMHVVIPAGNHGLPVAESHGPSSILDRWRFGGKCDCGGWDMACPLSVFSNPTVKIAQGHPLIDDQNPTELFVQGRKDDTPAFTMRVIEEGKYAVDFHAQLSSLQAFSICVAMLHAADASTIVGPERSKRMLQSDSITVLNGVTQEEKSKVNKMEEIMSSFVLNPPISPIARV